MDNPYVKIDHKDITDAITCLVDNPHNKIKDLDNDSKVLKSYQLIKFISTSLNKSELNDHLAKVISKEYRPTNILPNTVGAFLFGCSQGHYGDISRYCSPLCINNLGFKNISEIDESHTSSCDNQVWMQNDLDNNVRFYPLIQPKNSNKAYIFVDESFDGFTQKELLLLHQADVTKAKIITTKKSKHHIKLNWTNLNNLQRKDSNFLNEIEKQYNNDINIYPEINNSNKNFIYFGIFIIVLIILILFLRYSY
jgi:hypothetical protein